ncbi:MAG: hypothetical protein ACI4I5_07270 [Acutalibacteraceae bacterium]
MKKRVCIWMLVLSLGWTQTVSAFGQTVDSEAVLSSAKLSVVGRSANANVLIDGKAECTLWQTGNDAAGFSSSVYAYEAFVCADAQVVQLTVTVKNAAGDTVCSVDNGATWQEPDALQSIPLQDGKAVVLVKPCADSAAVYTFHIQSLCTDGAKLRTLSFDSNAEPCSPAFSPELAVTAALAKHDADAVEVSFTAAHGTQVYVSDDVNALKAAALPESHLLAPKGRTAEGEDLYALTVPTPLTANFNQITKALAVSCTDSDGRELRHIYRLYLFKVGTTDGVLHGIPDAVTDYLCPASQYTGGGNASWGMYGLFPEKTMTSTGNWNSCVSLGSFGGNITYYYEEPIVDDPRNPYGIDFTVFGNANSGASFSEPGEVQVSEDGKVWYTLAGSEHYDEKAAWNYTVTYEKSASGSACAYTDSFGNSGTLSAGFAPYTYPDPSLYPLHTAFGETLTVSGTRLYGANGKHGDGVESSSCAAFPQWGYADVHSNATASVSMGEDVSLLLTPVGNPYAADYNGYGDGFDLQWAVDANGLPVDAANLQVHYIKVQTCSFIHAGILGEKSTEVNCVVRTKPADTAVGITDVPVTVKIGDSEMVLHSDKKVYSVKMDAPLDISVSTAQDANVYINNARGTERTYLTSPDKGMIRIVVQRGEQAPLIYTLVADSETAAHTHVPAVRTDCVPSTCTAAGYTVETQYCSVCDLLLASTQTALPLASHTEGEAAVETAPTCQQEGSAVYRCTECGEVLRTEPLPTVPHQIEKGRCIFCGKYRFVIELQKYLAKVLAWFQALRHLFF